MANQWRNFFCGFPNTYIVVKFDNYFQTTDSDPTKRLYPQPWFQLSFIPIPVINGILKGLRAYYFTQDLNKRKERTQSTSMSLFDGYQQLKPVVHGRFSRPMMHVTYNASPPPQPISKVVSNDFLLPILKFFGKISSFEGTRSKKRPHYLTI